MKQRNFTIAKDLGLPRDKLAFIVMKARAYDAEVDAVDPDGSSNPADDWAVDALEMGPDNPNSRELRSAIAELDEHQRRTLVALVWVGRGDFEPDEWAQALALARERATGKTARYLMGIPLLGDLIEEGASRLGVSLTSDEQMGMHHPATERPREEDRD